LTANPIGKFAPPAQYSFFIIIFKKMEINISLHAIIFAVVILISLDRKAGNQKVKCYRTWVASRRIDRGKRSNIQRLLYNSDEAENGNLLDISIVSFVLKCAQEDSFFPSLRPVKFDETLHHSAIFLLERLIISQCFDQTGE